MGKTRDVRWRIGLDDRQQNFEHERNKHNLSPLELEELRIAAEEIRNATVEARIAAEEVCELAESARKYAEMLRASNSELRETTRMLRQAAIELAQSPKCE